MFDISLGIDSETRGYDNIRLRGLILGLTPSEIEKLMPDIVEFTELGDYLDLPGADLFFGNDDPPDLRCGNLLCP